MRARSKGMLAATLAAAALATACASGGDRPTEELVRARTLVEQAESGGAQQYAAADLERARSKLLAAEDAAESGDQEEARRLAEQAMVDAEYAAAETARVKSERSAQELQQSIESLRGEAQRGTAPGTEPGAPGGQ